MSLGHDWPRPEDPDAWRRQAACKGVDPNLFFPGKADRDQRQAALAYCESCEVREACLADALAMPSEFDHGIRGGLSRKQRLAITRRPRKPAECGTRSGYQRHLKNGETPCKPCQAANNAYTAENRRTRSDAGRKQPARSERWVWRCSFGDPGCHSRNPCGDFCRPAPPPDPTPERNNKP